MSATSTSSGRDLLAFRVLAWATLLVFGLASAPDESLRLQIGAICVAAAIVSAIVSELGWKGSRRGELALVADVVGLSLLVRVTGGSDSELRAAFPIVALAAFLVLDRPAALRVAAIDLGASLVAIGLDLALAPGQPVPSVIVSAAVVGGAVIGVAAIGYELNAAASAAARRAAAAEARRDLDLRTGQEALRRQAQVTGALLTVSERLASLTDPAAILKTLADAVRSATGSSYAVVLSWDRDLREAAVIATSGLTAARARRIGRLRLSARDYPILAHALGRGPQIVHRGDLSGAMPESSQTQWALAVAAATPIVIDRQPWGFLALGSTSRDETRLEPGSDLLAGLAGIAATAIGRSQAVAALERQAEMLELAVAERTAELNEVAAELRVASQAKTEFLANVSHELRTPLTSILGFSQVLLQGGQLSAEQREDVETISASSQHLLSLVDDLIDISRIEAGRITLQTEPIALRPLLEGVVEDVRALAGERGVLLSFVPGDPGDLPGTIDADLARLETILGNLLRNAIKFTPARGRVQLLATSVPPDHVRIDVVDTGIGIAPADQERIFEKFQRAGGPKFQGTGLGLPIARELAGLHGGDLTLESTLGIGSRFTLTLPVRDAVRGIAAASDTTSSPAPDLARGPMLARAPQPATSR